MTIGVSRKIDNLGRIVIPKELRSFYKFHSNDLIEVIATKHGILIRKPEYEVRKIDQEKYVEAAEKD